MVQLPSFQNVKQNAGEIWEDFFRVHPQQAVEHITDTMRKEREANGQLTISESVEAGYNNMVKRAGRGLWGGMLAAMSSGFGKGVLITAAIVVLGSALGPGLMAAAGILTTGTGAPVLFSQAFLTGGYAGLMSLGSTLGLVALGLGGLLGGINGMRKEQGHISAEVARTQANDYALMRSMQQQPQKENAVNNAAEISFREREAQRRAAQINSVQELH